VGKTSSSDASISFRRAALTTVIVAGYGNHACLCGSLASGLRNA
jgi:hypothetical protein